MRHKKIRRLPRKRVLISCYGPIAFDKKYGSPWEDISIRYKKRPGKPVNRWLTAISYDALLQDIEFEKELIGEYPEHEEAYTKQLRKLENIQEKLKTDDIYYEDDEGNFYTTAKRITRAEAERLLDYFMKINGFTNIKYVWKRPDFCVQPV